MYYDKVLTNCNYYSEPAESNGGIYYEGTLSLRTMIVNGSINIKDCLLRPGISDYILCYLVLVISMTVNSSFYLSIIVKNLLLRFNKIIWFLVWSDILI